MDKSQKASKGSLGVESFQILLPQAGWALARVQTGVEHGVVENLIAVEAPITENEVTLKSTIALNTLPSYRQEFFSKSGIPCTKSVSKGSDRNI